MSSKHSFLVPTLNNKGAALALALSMGAFALATGSASADPTHAGQSGWRGGERIYGFVNLTGSDSRTTGSCEGRLGAAILGGFAKPSDSPRIGQTCRF
ncbi:hypothetical protein [uncultured Rhodoblastus sp.]|uniref:hypothetical protein n=1 Tax=uncultured Rhodoblastus sp. TaxID=543037 RepID=UPI0025EC12EA|nr:hypothetical protein [uncultured Rhodoblastus sp.]